MLTHHRPFQLARIFTAILAIGAAGWLAGTNAATADDESPNALDQLAQWLEDDGDPSALSGEPFAETPLTREEAEEGAQRLWAAWLADHEAAHAAVWEEREVHYEDVTMRFDYRVFGEAPERGRSLYISLHGGGGTRPEVNDAQWRNQIGLYEPDEGLYVAPRAPTNDWDLWHKDHIDPLFDRLIVSAVAHKGVDPNRVYVMGYSAGGDGVYQLAPRMADRWAAAAMMAGHPNNASPLNLRNIGFTLHMGGQDSAYNRNEVAAEWKETLADLHAEDPEGYLHEAVIHPQHGHWMELDDAVAVDWMAGFTRDPYPDRIVWRQDNVSHPRFYWLATPPAYHEEGALIRAERNGNTFRILETEGVDEVTLLLNDSIADLDEPVRVIGPDDKELFEGTAPRTMAALAESIATRPDPAYLFTAAVTVRTNGDEADEDGG